MKFTKETFYRAKRTFIQAVVGCIAAGLVAVATDVFNDPSTAKAVLLGFVVSAVSTGIAAVMNMEEFKGKTEPEVKADGRENENL